MFCKTLDMYYSHESPRNFLVSALKTNRLENKKEAGSFLELMKTSIMVEVSKKIIRGIRKDEFREGRQGSYQKGQRSRQGTGSFFSLTLRQKTFTESNSI